MKWLLSGKALRRFAAAGIGLFIVGAVAAPNASPARGDGPIAIAVASFQNEAGAPASVVGDLTSAAYKAIASSGKYVAKGGGPLPNPKTLTSDPFMDLLQAAARVGADEVLIPSVVRSGGGQVYYRLSLYRVAPLTFIGSQIFSQPYPPADANALAAAFGSNVATLSAPRQAIGTIYSVVDATLADTGTEEGFSLGDRFNVLRQGQKVAEATIASIRADYATLSISNAMPGYKPMLGDKLAGVRALPPVPPAPPVRSTFSALGFFAAVGGVLLAIGHHGQPGGPCSPCVAPSPTGSVFKISQFFPSGHPPSGFIEFDFSDILSTASQQALPGNLNYASFTLQPPGSQSTTQPAPLGQLGPVTFALDPTAKFTIMHVGETMPGLITGEIYDMTFTNLNTSVSGSTLVPETTGNQPLSIFIKRLPDMKPLVGPAAPGPAGPGGPKPGVGPNGPPPENPKPGPNDPHIPH